MEEELKLPDGFVFQDLQLMKHPPSKGLIVLNEVLLDKVLASNGIDPEGLRKHPLHSYISLHAVASCYRVHIATGGRRDELMEQLSAGTLKP
jgi:hypothetical protein